MARIYKNYDADGHEARAELWLNCQGRSVGLALTIK